MVAVGTDSQFKKLCRVLGKPELAADPKFATNPARVTNREELVAILSASFRTRPRAEWERLLLAAGIPAGPVNSFSELFGDPGLVDDLLVEVNHPTAGRYQSVRCPLPQATPPAELPPPRLGEHNELLSSWLRETG